MGGQVQNFVRVHGLTIANIGVTGAGIGAAGAGDAGRGLRALRGLRGVPSGGRQDQRRRVERPKSDRLTARDHAVMCAMM